MSLMDDVIEWLDFCDHLAQEMKDSKASDYRIGLAEGVEMAADMLRDYLVEYPEYVDPKEKYKKFKM